MHKSILGQGDRLKWDILHELGQKSAWMPKKVFGHHRNSYFFCRHSALILR